MAKHVFIIEVADTDEPLTEVDVEGLESAFQTIEAVEDAKYLGLATGEPTSMHVITPNSRVEDSLQS